MTSKKALKFPDLAGLHRFTVLTRCKGPQPKTDDRLLVCWWSDHLYDQEPAARKTPLYKRLASWMAPQHVFCQHRGVFVPKVDGEACCAAAEKYRLWLTGMGRRVWDHK